MNCGHDMSLTYFERPDCGANLWWCVKLWPIWNCCASWISDKVLSAKTVLTFLFFFPLVLSFFLSCGAFFLSFSTSFFWASGLRLTKTWTKWLSDHVKIRLTRLSCTWIKTFSREISWHQSIIWHQSITCPVNTGHAETRMRSLRQPPTPDRRRSKRN